MEQQHQEAHLTSNHQNYPQLAPLLALFLQTPTPDIEHQLASFHPHLYITLILNPNQPKQIRQACASAFKAQINNRKVFEGFVQDILQQLYTLYLSSNDKMIEILPLIEMLIEKIYELYLDDEKKLTMFVEIMQKINQISTMQNGLTISRGFILADMLLKLMDVTTINNQVCIGELICYLKAIYYKPAQELPENSLFGKGPRLMEMVLLNSFTSQEDSRKGRECVQLQVKLVQIIYELILRLISQNEEGEDGGGEDLIPVQYIKNSQEIEKLLYSIISISPFGKIHSNNKIINQLKSKLLQLFNECYIYHVQEPFLVVCLNTISNSPLNQIIDEVQTILTQVLVLVQRSTSYGNYTKIFYNSMQLLVFRLFQFACLRETEKQAIETDPEYFAEISDDFCKTQQNQSLKMRAGSLIYNLCLLIDGSLTFVTNMALISLYSLQKELSEKLLPQKKSRELVADSTKGLTSLLELWCIQSAESITQVSLLIICSISDLLSKRQQFDKQIREHLSVMHHLFLQQDKIAELLSPVIIARYIQIFSYFSFQNCLEPFLPFYSLKPVYAETILKSLQTLIQYHDKKDENMRFYVTKLSTRVLLLSDKMTPLLQQTIVSRPELIICIKQKLVQKLILWLLDYFQSQNLFGCNKISNLLCLVINKYPNYIVQSDQNGFNYDLMALTQYLIPLYKQLIEKHHHPAEQCVIDIIITHIECLGLSIQTQLAKKFILMAIKVVQNNNLALNKCLQLFSRLLSRPYMQRNKQNMQYSRIRDLYKQVAMMIWPKVNEWISKDIEREIDVWQLLFLMEMVLVRLVQQNMSFQQLHLQKIQSIYLGTRSTIIHIKIVNILMIILYQTKTYNHGIGQFAIQLMANQQIPLNKIPPYELNNYTIFIIQTLNHQINIQHKLITLKYINQLIQMPNRMNKYIKDYEEKIVLMGDNDEIEAFQINKEVLHPMNSKTTDVYKQFKVMYLQMNDWQQVRQLLTAQQSNDIRDILRKEMVGSQTRKIYHVKK